MNIQITDTSKLGEAARMFLHETGANRIFAFYGQMGAGKTTFIKAICKELGVTDVVTSPTFTLINEYRRPGHNDVYHFDFYRIKEVSEVFDFGFEEYTGGASYCFMEWPEKIEPVLPAGTVKVYINVNPDGSRTVRVDQDVYNQL
ncbi:MAG TPA: tRNA (adenosine(37)-N6)-threonylcarbamoyltransferase complex ATPase subunit type 1 TsaE [Bacteroidales bacterium]|nr:tRNA (adenosine(37)-N6)-threonylcarbamoyltransferase complex ATPase subunit type 1 TsaE [Bacteroidales bacterium]HPT12778.1 tRNA (adenosine(37)-N6)-threonylcarbamoyltransferase complex ATPase subunit type 1 TsaE [Bacteroidales bacterium]